MPDQRPTAVKAIIDDVINADYVTQEPPRPNHLVLYGQRVKRLQLIGVLVQKSSHDFVIDDGTNRITAKRFNQRINLDDTKPGEPVLVIAQPREHEQTVFLGAEAVSPVDDKAWITTHHDIVNATHDRDATLDTTTKADTTEDTTNHSADILDTINDLDDGDGATTEDVIEASSLDDAETYIERLINEGEIFEIRPGKLKVL